MGGGVNISISTGESDDGDVKFNSEGEYPEEWAEERPCDALVLAHARFGKAPKANCSRPGPTSGAQSG